MSHSRQSKKSRQAPSLIAGKDISLLEGGKYILHHVDIDVRANEIVSLIGPNGAGKTSLLKILLGITNATSGTIKRKKNLKIGYMPQKIHIERTLPLTAQSFLSLSAKHSTNHEQKMIKLLNIESVLETPLQRLSGGEMQKLMLVRAMLNKPDLLILDEPAQNLDVTGQADLYKLLQKLRKEFQLAILIVSHDLHLVMQSTDQVVCLNQHVCCSGHAESVKKHPEYLKLFDANTVKEVAVYKHHHDHHHTAEGHIVHD